MSEKLNIEGIREELLAPLNELETFDQKNKYLTETVFVVGGKERTVLEIINRIPELESEVNTHMLSSAIGQFGNPEDPGYTFSRTQSDEDLLNLLNLIETNTDIIREKYPKEVADQFTDMLTDRNAKIEELKIQKKDLGDSITARRKDFDERAQYFAGEMLYPWLTEVDPEAESLVDKYDFGWHTMPGIGNPFGHFVTNKLTDKVPHEYNYVVDEYSQEEGTWGVTRPATREEIDNPDLVESPNVFRVEEGTQNPFAYAGALAVGGVADWITGLAIPAANLLTQLGFGWTDLFKGDDDIGRVELRNMMWDPERETWGIPEELKAKENEFIAVSKALDELQDVSGEATAMKELHDAQSANLDELSGSVVDKLVKGGYSTYHELQDILSK